MQPLTKLTSRVVRLMGLNPGPMTLQGTNTYLVGLGSRRVLIDTGDGCQPDYVTMLVKHLADNNVSISSILLTHWHRDHVGGVRDILQALYKISDEEIKVMKLKREDHDEQESICKDLQYLTDNDVINVDNQTHLRVMHLPGHTEDHMCLHLTEENSVFTGDCILGQGSTVFEDLQSYMASLSTLQAMQDVQCLYPGHGPTIEGAENVASWINTYIRHRQNREQEIVKSMADGQPVTVENIVRRVYSKTPERLWPAAAGSVALHLTKLVKDGKVIKDEQGETFKLIN